MAWNTPTSVSPGDAILASLYNEDVVDNLTELAPFFGAWTSYTPTSRTGYTVGNGTETAVYLKIGRTVFYRFNFTLGSTSSITADFSFVLPFNTQGFTTALAIFTETGVNAYPGFAIVGSNTLRVLTTNVAGTYPAAATLSATVPFTWGNTDKVQVSGVYEATS